PEGCRFWRLELGIERFIMGMAVMGEMEIAEPGCRHEDDETGCMRDRPVEPIGFEGRAMDTLMERGEEEDDRDPQRHKQKGPIGNAKGNWDGEHRNERQM